MAARRHPDRTRSHPAETQVIMAMLSTPRRQIPGSYFATPGPAATGSRFDGSRSLFDPAPGPIGGMGSSLAATSTLATDQLTKQPQQQQPQQQQQQPPQQSQRSLVPLHLPEIVPALPPPVVLTPVQKAALSVSRVLQLEESYPDLDSYCRRESTLQGLSLTTLGFR